MVLGAALELAQLRLGRVLLALVLAHLADEGIFLESLQVSRISDCARGCGKEAVGGWRTSMSSFHGMSASGCERAPLTVTACLLAGGAESSGFGRLRSSILTASSDGIGTVLVASLIEQTTAWSEGHGWRRATQIMKEMVMSGLSAAGRRRRDGAD